MSSSRSHGSRSVKCEAISSDDESNRRNIKRPSSRHSNSGNYYSHRQDPYASRSHSRNNHYSPRSTHSYHSTRSRYRNTRDERSFYDESDSYYYDQDEYTPEYSSYDDERHRNYHKKYRRNIPISYSKHRTPSNKGISVKNDEIENNVSINKSKIDNNEIVKDINNGVRPRADSFKEKKKEKEDQYSMENYSDATDNIDDYYPSDEGYSYSDDHRYKYHNHRYHSNRSNHRSHSNYSGRYSQHGTYRTSSTHNNRNGHNYTSSRSLSQSGRNSKIERESIPYDTNKRIVKEEEEKRYRTAEMKENLNCSTPNRTGYITSPNLLEEEEIRQNQILKEISKCDPTINEKKKNLTLNEKPEESIAVATTKNIVNDENSKKTKKDTNQQTKIVNEVTKVIVINGFDSEDSTKISKLQQTFKYLVCSIEFLLVLTYLLQAIYYIVVSSGEVPFLYYKFFFYLFAAVAEIICAFIVLNIQKHAMKRLTNTIAIHLPVLFSPSFHIVTIFMSLLITPILFGVDGLSATISSFLAISGICNVVAVIFAINLKSNEFEPGIKNQINSAKDVSNIREKDKVDSKKKETEETAKEDPTQLEAPGTNTYGREIHSEIHEEYNNLADNDEDSNNFSFPNDEDENKDTKEESSSF